MTRTSFVSEFVTLRGENDFEPHPQRKILVPFKISDDHLRIFVCELTLDT